MQKLIEFNENQNTPLYRPYHLEDLKHKSEYFEVPDLETRIQRHGNPHYWLQQDILQVKYFQYRFFINIFSRMTLFLKSKFLLNFYQSFSNLTINYFGNNKINKLILTFLKYQHKQNSYHTS